MMVILLIVGGLVTVVAAAILNGWALSVMWSWFIVPTLGAKPLSIAAAIGITATVGMLVRQGGPSSAGKDQSTGAVIATSFFTTFAVLGLGWIVHQFM